MNSSKYQVSQTFIGYYPFYRTGSIHACIAQQLLLLKDYIIAYIHLSPSFNHIAGMEGLGMSDSAPPANGTGHAAVPPPPAAPAAPTAPKFSVAPPPPPPIAPVVPTAPVAPVYHTAAAEEDDSELKIVSNYVPRIAGSGTGKVTNTMTMMDPISGTFAVLH